MAEKRKSSSGILLKKGESQLSNGKYRYRYFDDAGQAHEITSWRLRPEDPMPEGRKPGGSLREQEQEIQKQLSEGLKAWNGGQKVKELVQEFMKKNKTYWSPGTYHVYDSAFRNHVDGTVLSRKSISKVSVDDVEALYANLYHDKGLSIGTISSVDRVLNPAFRMAVRRRDIPTNPTTGALSAVKRKTGATQKHRSALEESDLNALLEYIKENEPYYYSMFYFLSWTGCRIGEGIGLQWQDVDFQEEIIHIRHTLEYCKVDGHFQNIMRDPKTEAGKREIPMLKDVKKILLELRQGGKVTNISRNEYVFLGEKCGKVTGRALWDKKLRDIIRRYNKDHDNQIPVISCHILRHTFCCWLIEHFSCGEGASILDNLKYVQQIMGHADASMTLNVYSEIRGSKLKEKHDLLKRKAAGD